MSTGTARDCDDRVLTRDDRVRRRRIAVGCPRVSSPSCSPLSLRPRARRAGCRSPAPSCGCAPTARARCRGCRRASAARCGLPSHRRGCPAARAAFARAWAPLAYDGVARELVAALKFRGALPVAALMAAHMAANLPADLRGRPEPRGRPAIVPVPPQPARARRRGFDPAGALAAALAPRLGLPESACLRRRDREGRQVGATRAQRRRRRPAGDRAARRRRPRARCSSTTSTRPARRSTPAPARCVAGGCREVVALTYARTL